MGENYDKMSQLEKKKQRLLSVPNDYTYSEAKSLLEQLGYIEDNKGKTSGSRVRFFNKTDNTIIHLHKPHPGDIMKEYSVKLLKEYLENKGEI